MSERMTDERLALLRTAWHGHNDALTELIDALLAERAEVERLRAKHARTMRNVRSWLNYWVRTARENDDELRDAYAESCDDNTRIAQLEAEVARLQAELSERFGDHVAEYEIYDAAEAERETARAERTWA